MKIGSDETDPKETMPNVGWVVFESNLTNFQRMRQEFVNMFRKWLDQAFSLRNIAHGLGQPLLKHNIQDSNDIGPNFPSDRWKKVAEFAISHLHTGQVLLLAGIKPPHSF